MRRSGLETLGEPGAAADDLPTIVILRADRSASYGAVRRTLEIAQEKGFAHFSLVVLQEGRAMSTGAGLGMGLCLSGPEAEPTTVRTEAIDPMRPGRGATGPGRPMTSPSP